MSNSALNYLANLGRLLRRDRLLRPLVAVYHVTTRCNLNCAYCEDFGRRRNATALPPLPLDEGLRVLRTIRSGTDHLILTGGEPLLHPHIAELAARARRDLRFRHLTLLTNGLLLPQHEALLPHLDRLMVSLDATEPRAWAPLVGISPGEAGAILDNVRHYARRQGEFGYRLVLNCVLSPQLPGAGAPGEVMAGPRQVLALAREQGVLVSFSPQSVNNWPHYDLLVADEYRAFLRELLALKRRGAPILGSVAYFKTLLDLRPYSCYPTLVPRIMPGGELLYPCWPIEKEGDSHGGRPCNLREVDSWDQVLAHSAGIYGQPPRVCTACFQQCYAEASLMQAQPLSFLAEWLRYAPSRRGSVATYAPG
jgi:MoaA/NifB/PqqE/SkfB family radical SAM enzyme